MGDNKKVVVLGTLLVATEETSKDVEEAVVSFEKDGEEDNEIWVENN